MLTAGDLLELKGHDVVSAAPDTRMRHALTAMRDHNVGCMVVKEDGKIVGIWTERDMLKNALDATFDLDATTLADVMVRDLTFTPHTDTVYMLMDEIVRCRHRRLLIRREEEFLGLLTAGDVMKAFLREKTREIQNLNHMVGWEYYEDWRWSPDR